jgi:MFS family permease
MVAEETHHARADTKSRLAVMMVLVYAVQGSWWPLLAVHLRDLGISGRGQGWIFASMALASLVTPLGVGQLADRRWPSQRVMAAIFGSGTLWLVLVALGTSRSAPGLFLIFLTYWLITAPIYGLSASLAFRNLAHPRAEYGGVRLWGTVGWMVVSWVVSVVLAFAAVPGQGAAGAFWVGALVSVVAALYCLTLPNTPPLAAGPEGHASLREGLEVLHRPGVAVYMITAFAVCLTTPCVYQVLPPLLRDRGLPVAWVPVALTLGQFPEVAALAFLPRLMTRIGYRGTLALGIACWAVRFGSLAFDPPLWVALLGMPLNGVAIASFHVAGQLYLDGEAPPHLRASSQGIYFVVCNGIGALTGNVLVGELTGLFPGQYGQNFLVPTLINVVALGVFFCGFRATQARETKPRTLPAPRSLAAARLAPEGSPDVG